MKLIETMTEDDRALIKRYRAGEKTEETRAAWKRYWTAGKAQRDAVATPETADA